jgi:hypothetical protein
MVAAIIESSVQNGARQLTRIDSVYWGIQIKVWIYSWICEEVNMHGSRKKLAAYTSQKLDTNDNI